LLKLLCIPTKVIIEQEERNNKWKNTSLCYSEILIVHYKFPFVLWLFTLFFQGIVIANEMTISADTIENTKEISAFDQRIQIERETRYQSFVLTPHKPNYIMPITYNEKPNNASQTTSDGAALDKNEVKFQFSMKFPMVEDLFGEQGTLYFAYTNLSFWQAYNVNTSSPFRETVHEPEVFLTFPKNDKYLGFTNRMIQVGYTHQSNGRSGELSRSWNRFYADFIFQKGNYYLSLKPWYRIEPPRNKDNPDIEKYLGHGEIRGVYAEGKHTVSVMLRNNFHSPNYGAFEFNWSFPMSRRVKWFVQYFNGYGESLIDYNARVNRIGIGIAFTDWL